MLLQCTEAETGFVFQHLRSSSLQAPSWYGGLRLKLVLVPKSTAYQWASFVCPAPNRSVKEIAVELSLSISTFIGIPRSWYVDLRDSPTWPPFTTAWNSASPTLKAVKLWSVDPDFTVWLPILATNPVVLFLGTGSPAKPLSTKTVILWTCFCLRNLSAALGFPHQIPAMHVSTGQSWIHEARSFSWPNVSLFLQDPICLGPSMKVSYKQICILSHPRSLESDSVFLLITFLSCSFPRGVLNFRVRIASRFTDDERCMSQVKFNVPSTVQFDQSQL